MIGSSGGLAISLFQIQIFRYFLLTFAFALLYLWVKKMIGLTKIIDKIPGPRRQFLIGNLGFLGIFSSTGDTYKDLEQLLQRAMGFPVLFKSSFIRMWIFFLPFIIVFRYKAAEAILSNSSLGEKTPEYRFFEPIMGKGLVTCSFEKNKKRRKLILPALSIKLLDDFLKTFNRHSKVTVEKIYETLDEDFVEVVSLFSLYALDIICETAMSIQCNFQRKGQSKYSKSVIEIDRMVLERGIRPWLWPDFLYYRLPQGKKFREHLDVVSQFTMKVIEKQKERFLKEREITAAEDLDTKKRTMPFIDILLTEHIKSPADFTLHDVKEEVDTFMGAGFDTLTMSCSWALFLIGQHPEVQVKLQDELFEIFGNDLEKDVTMEDAKQMKYMECVIKECQRLYPSVPFIGKNITQDIVVEGNKVPKGVGCYILIMAMHHDPDVFPNPYVFDPDRFLPENSAGRNSYAFLPFSAGVRACVGQKYALLEEKTTLAHILRNFTVKSLDSRDKVMPYPDIVLRTHAPIRIKFEARFPQ